MNNTMNKLVLDFLEYLEVHKRYSQLTIREYHLYLSRFCDWVNNNYPGIHPEMINLEILNKYRLFLSRYQDTNGRTLKYITQSYYIIAIRSFFRFLIVQKNLNILSPDKIELPKQSQRIVNFLNIDQIERFLNAPSISNAIGLRDKAILETLFSTGMRVSEIAALNRDHIDLKRQEFGIRGKGNKVRVVFLSDTAAKWISEYLKTRDDSYKPLFIRYGKKGKIDIKQIQDKKGENLRLSVRSIQNIVDKYAQKCGLPVKVTPHIIRHSFATDLLISGADLRSVQEMLGHASIRTTQVYTHVTNKHLKDVHKAFHTR